MTRKPLRFVLAALLVTSGCTIYFGDHDDEPDPWPVYPDGPSSLDAAITDAGPWPFPLDAPTLDAVTVLDAGITDASPYGIDACTAP